MMHVPRRTADVVRLAAALAVVSTLGHAAVGQKPDAPGKRPGESTAAPTAHPPFTLAVPANLGEPLVDAPQALRRLDASSPAWIDKKNRRIVLVGSVCKASYPLEFFATYPDRAYESLLVVYTKPSVVHAGLLALGAEPGKPARYRPSFVPASGTPVEIDVAWKDADGKRRTVRAQELIRNIKTGKPLGVDWVFAGSMLWKDASTGANSYLADRGDFISVASVTTAMLDLPIESDTALATRLFEGDVDRLPPEGTPVTLILKPKGDSHPGQPR